MKKSKLNWFYVFLLLLSVNAGYAQNKVLTGKVSESGLPLPGVSVTINGSNVGEYTDLEGNYSLKVQSGDIVVFSFIGMSEVTYKVGDVSIYNVTLFNNNHVLDEVIVVGYGTTTRDAFSGSASQISAKDIEKKNVSSALVALMGEAAGVNVINSTGQPGSDPIIRIRGYGSVNGNRGPLIILDGAPYNESFSSINTSDIASMTVLKDASATAIYGARGANGVVVINTKSGKGAKSFIEIDAKTGVNWRALPQYDVVKSPEKYIEYSYEGLVNYGKIKSGYDESAARLWAGENLFTEQYGISPVYNMWNVLNGSELIDPATGKIRLGVTRKYTPEDWKDYAFKSAKRTEVNVNMGGSNNSTSYFSSVGYLKDDGYSIKTDFERLTARLNLQHKPKEWFDAKMNVGYSHSQLNFSGQGGGAGNLFSVTENIPSIYPLFLRDEKGGFLKDIYGGREFDYGMRRGFSSMSNSIADAKYGKNKGTRDEINIRASFTIKMYDGLSFETTIGGQYLNSNSDFLSNRFYGPAVALNGSIFKIKSEVFSYNWLKLLRYKNLFGSHRIEALVAHENSSSESKTNMMYNYNLTNPNNVELNNGTSSMPSKGYKDEATLESYFGQVNYDYENKYFLTASMRRDGSSRFKNTKWGTFSSFGVSWVVSRENFMEDQNVFSSLKLKASYGTIGDQNVGSYYAGENLWTTSVYGGKAAIYEGSIGNPDLSWEKAKMFQIGVEFGINDYVDVNVDYYVKNTTNLIFRRGLGPSAGYEVITVNDGKLRNKGVEFNVTGHILKSKDAFIDLSINGEYLNNKLTKMPIDPEIGKEKNLEVIGNYGRSSGHSLADFYMREWAGVNSDTGQSQWYTYTYVGDDGTKRYVESMTDFLAKNPAMQGELTKETTTDYSKSTLQYVGKSSIPKLRGGINLSAGYKGWELGVQMVYSLGGYGYDGGYAALMGNERIGSNNWHSDIANRWQKRGDITDVPRISNNADSGSNSPSTRFLIKSDFLSINNLRLGYKLPNKFIKAIGLAELSFYMSGDNLFLLVADGS